MRVMLIACLLCLSVLPAAVASAQQGERKPVYPTGPAAYYGTEAVGDKPAKLLNPAAPYDGQPLGLQLTKVGHDALEPTVGVHADNTIFYAAGGWAQRNPVFAAGAATEIMRSTDGGLTWQTLASNYAPGDGKTDLDPYVYVEPDTGRVFRVALVGAGSFLSWSKDKGETWETSAATAPGVNDHQTLIAANPPPNGNLEPTDPEFPKILYYCVNQIGDAACAASEDGGQTFLPSGQPAYRGGEADASPLCSAIHGHLQADLEGRIFLPSGHCGVPVIAISEDGGMSWAEVKISNIPADIAHTEVAVDRAGNLFYVFHDDEFKLPYLSVSRDHGKTWSKARMIAPPNVFDVNFPTIVAGEAGRIAMTFPGTTVDDQTDATRPWNAYVVVSTDALAPSPLFVSNIANPAEDPLHRGNCSGRCGAMFDFLDIQIAPTDGTVYATTSDGCVEACAKDREGARDRIACETSCQGMLIKQTGGPRLLGDPNTGTVVHEPHDDAPPTTGRFADRVAPKVTRVRFRRGRLSFRLSEKATVTIGVDGRRAKTVRGKRGSNRFKLRVRRGRHRITVRAFDAAGNASAVKKLRVRVRR